MKFVDGSIWWTISPPFECADPYEIMEPRRVKVWRKKEETREDYAYFSSFDEDGKIDDDSNATTSHSTRDINHTVFSEEHEAWAAYLGDVLSVDGYLYALVQELETQARHLDAVVRQSVSEETRKIVSTHAKNRWMVAGKLRLLLEGGKA